MREPFRSVSRNSLSHRKTQQSKMDYNPAKNYPIFTAKSLTYSQRFSQFSTQKQTEQLFQKNTYKLQPYTYHILPSVNLPKIDGMTNNNKTSYHQSGSGFFRKLKPKRPLFRTNQAKYFKYNNSQQNDSANFWLKSYFLLCILLIFGAAVYALVKDEEEMTLETLKEKLRHNYKSKARIKRLFSDETVDMQEDYIHLAVVEESEQKEKERQLAEKDDQMGFLGTYEDIYETKKSITAQEIFNNSSDNHLLVLGRAAIGKSTFFKYLLNLWAHGKLWQDKFELVFWISYRDLEKYKEDKNIDLYEILNRECFADSLDEAGKSTLKRLVETLEPQGKVLYMLDGKDELPSFKYEGTKLESVLNRIAASPYWITSSRPYGYDYERMQPDKKLEVLGFTNDNIENYVEVFFAQRGKKPEDGTSLLQLLRRNKSWWGSAHIPLNLELICSYWELEPNKDKLNEHIISSSALYQNVIATLLKRYLKRKNASEEVKVDYNTLSDEELYDRTKHIIYFLSRLAFEALNEKSFLLSPTLVNKVLNQTKRLYPAAVKADSTFLSEILDAGFLNTPDPGEDNTRKHFYFNHATFLEWFAAADIATQLSTCDDKLGNEHNVRTLNLIAEHKYDPRYEIAWSFVSGILNLREDYPSLQRFFDYLYLEPRDILGFYEMRLLIRCLDEALYEKPINRTHKPILRQSKDILEHLISCIEIKHVQQIELEKALESRFKGFGYDRNFGCLTYCNNVKKILLPLILIRISYDNQPNSGIDYHKYFSYHFDVEDSESKILSFMIDNSLSEHIKTQRFDKLIGFVSASKYEANPNFLQELFFQVLSLLHKNPGRLKGSVERFLNNRLEKLKSIDSVLICTTLKDRLFQILDENDEEIRCNAINILTLVAKDAPLDVKHEIYNNLVKYRNTKSSRIKNELNFSLYTLSKGLLLNEESKYYADQIKNISTSGETQNDESVVKSIRFIDNNFSPQTLELVKYVDRLIPISLNGKKPHAAMDAAIMIGEIFGRLDADSRKYVTAKLIDELKNPSKDLQITESAFTVNFSSGLRKATVSTKLSLIQDLLAFINANNFISAPLIENLLSDRNIAQQHPDEWDRIVVNLVNKYTTTNSNLYLPRDFSHLLSQKTANQLALQLINNNAELNTKEFYRSLTLLEVITKKVGAVTAEKVAEYLLNRKLITNISLKEGYVKVVGNTLVEIAKNSMVNKSLSNTIAHNLVNSPLLFNSYLSNVHTSHPFDHLPFHIILYELDSTNKLPTHMPILIRRYLTATFPSSSIYAIFGDKNNILFYENGTVHVHHFSNDEIREHFIHGLRNTYLYVKESSEKFTEICYPMKSPPIKTPLHHTLSNLKSFNMDQTQREILVKDFNVLIANASLVNDNNNETRITPLMLAVETGESYYVNRLLGAGANTFLRNNRGESAFDIAFTQFVKDPYNEDKQEILKALISRRTSCSYLDFERNFNQLECVYSGQTVNKDTDHRLINQFVERFIGRISRVKGDKTPLSMEALIASERERYITHINSIRDASFKGKSLNGFDGLEFLALRIRAYTEILLKLTAGELKQTTLHIPKEQAISAIKREILIMHETLTVAKNVRKIKKEMPSDAIFGPKRMQALSETLYNAEVTNVVTQLKQLRENEEYVSQSGWSENHCVYVAFRRMGPEVVVRVDNRGVKSRSDNKSETVACEPLPEVERLSGYTKDILLSFYDFSDGAKKVYSNHFSKPDCVWRQKGGQWPSFYRQIGENCVLANFEAGTSVRLEQDFGAEKGQQFHTWLIGEEATIVEKSLIPTVRPKI